jgi:hypothetical protein
MQIFTGSQPSVVMRSDNGAYSGRYIGSYCGCLGCRKYSLPFDACQALPAESGCPRSCSSCTCFENCDCSTGNGRLDITVEDIHVKGSPYVVEIVKTVGSAAENSEVLQTYSKVRAGVKIPIFVQARDMKGMDSEQGVENFTLSYFNQIGASYTTQTISMISFKNGLYGANLIQNSVGIYAYQVYLSESPLSGGERGTVRFGSDTSVTLEDSANEDDEFYTGFLVLVRFNEIGKLTQVSGYSGMSRRCTFADPLPFTLNTSFQYLLFPPKHVIDVVPGDVSPQQTLFTCYSDSKVILFIDGSDCGLEKAGIARTSFLFLVIFRDAYSNELTSGIELGRLSMKISRLYSGADGSSMALNVQENWCSEQAMLSAEQCTQKTYVFQCEGQSELFSTGRCGGQCNKENCVLIKSELRTWHRSDGSLLAKYSGWSK